MKLEWAAQSLARGALSGVPCNPTRKGVITLLPHFTDGETEAQKR